MNKQEAIHFLTHDQKTGEYTGNLIVPCSRWGRNSADCAEVAYDLDVILCAETGEDMAEHTLDGAMSLVVNDHDDVAYTFASYGGEHSEDTVDVMREDSDPVTTTRTQTLRQKYEDEIADWGDPEAYGRTGDPHAWDEDDDWSEPT